MLNRDGVHRTLSVLAGSLVVMAAVSSSQPAAQVMTATCAGTAPVRATPPSDPNAEFGSDLWYINADRSIWAIAGRWIAGAEGNKILWIRPRGRDLILSGRRIDADEEAPLRSGIACCYRSGFQPSRVYFPSAGCWEVTGRSGQQSLTFTVQVF